MPLTLTVTDMLLRLACALVAGAVIGFNRGEHGKAAGLRTTLLVCLAAAVAMLQVNALLPLAGKAPDSFITNDLMRLPLGILTGVGFIGAGAILHRGDRVSGVTTAATLWYVTMLGLCFGGGQLVLGWAATALGCAILWVLRWLEGRIAMERRARLSVELDGESPSEAAIHAELAGAMRVRAVGVSIEAGRRRYVFAVALMRAEGDTRVPPVVEALARAPGVRRVDWQFTP